LTESDNQYFLRQQNSNGLDGYAFHYSIYRALTRFLGMDGNLAVAYDLDTNFITAWNEMFVNNDFLNPNTGQFDPKHLFGASNFDVFRWPSLANGTLRSALASYIAYVVMPGVPMVGVVLERLSLQYLPFTGILWRGAGFLSLRLHRFKLSLRVGY
jgi:alpha-1,3-glucan synthase